MVLSCRDIYLYAKEWFGEEVLFYQFHRYEYIWDLTDGIGRRNMFIFQGTGGADGGHEYYDIERALRIEKDQREKERRLEEIRRAFHERRTKMVQKVEKVMKTGEKSRSNRTALGNV